MAGRIGNVVTINGHVPEKISVLAGERLRLRLINAAPARIFGLEFRDLRPLIVALDGQPVEPREPSDNRVVLGPAMRADVLLDMSGTPGATASVVDTFYRDFYKLVELEYGKEPLLRAQPLHAPSRIRSNTMPEPDIDNAEKHTAVLGAG